jgi:phage baseplate assembly protein W
VVRMKKTAQAILSHEERVKLAMATTGRTRQEAEHWVDIVDGKSKGDCLAVPGKKITKTAAL